MERLWIYDSLAWVGVLVFGRQAAYKVAAVAVGRGTGNAVVRGGSHAGRRTRVTRRGRRTATRRRRIATAAATRRRRRHRTQPFRLHVGRGSHFVVIVVLMIVVVVVVAASTGRAVMRWMLDLHTDRRTSALGRTKQVDVSLDVH